jgi:hypothetical protein
MAREGFLILDSDLHMMEPDDLWARYLDGQHRANPPTFYGGQGRQLSENKDDKGNADAIMGMQVQGLQIPAHNMQQGATVSSRELRRRSRARHPHFQVARARGYDAISTLTAMDIEGIDVAVMYGTRGRQILCHDDLAPAMPQRSLAPITTGPPITAKPIRSGSNSPRSSPCTMFRPPSRRRDAR